MTHYKVTLAYDGTNFAGYQVQPKQRTVQGVLQKALTKMAKGQPVHVDGSGRTDSGVHALGQVISFDYPGNIPAESMLRAMNSLMPLDIEILKAELSRRIFMRAIQRRESDIGIGWRVAIIRIRLIAFTQDTILISWMSSGLRLR